MADQFIAGQHDAQIRDLQADMTEVKADVKWIRESLAEQRGERRVALWAASGIAGTIGAAVSVAIRGLLGKHG